jgi:hypothetical protein
MPRLSVKPRRLKAYLFAATAFFGIPGISEVSAARRGPVIRMVPPRVPASCICKKTSWAAGCELHVSIGAPQNRKTQIPRVKRATGPWGARGWSEFCEAKFLLAHASWIEAEIPQTPQGARNCSGKPGFFPKGKNAHIFKNHSLKIYFPFHRGWL